MAVWVVRAGKNGEAEDAALKEGFVSIFWNKLQDLSVFDDRRGLKRRYRRAYPDLSEREIGNHVGQIWAFRSEIRAGDLVILPRRKVPNCVAVGEITGTYLRRTDLPNGVRHTRPVTWLHIDLPVDAFDAELQRAFGRPPTVYPVRRADLVRRVRALLEKSEVGRLAEEVADVGRLFEGAIKTVTVNAYERNRKAREKCIQHHGWGCAACGHTMADLYGQDGEGLIHVHHLRELHTVGEDYEVDPIADLRPVCPNCHAILHRRSPPMSVEQLRLILAGRRSRKL